MITFEYEDKTRQNIKKFTDGKWDGRYIPTENFDTNSGVPTDPAIPQEVLAKAAKVSREEAINAPIEAHGVIWDIDTKSRDNMRSALDTATRRASRFVNWVLADNTIRSSSPEDLMGVMDAYADRMEAVYTHYTIWRMGSMTEPFAYNKDL